MKNAVGPTYHLYYSWKNICIWNVNLIGQQFLFLCLLCTKFRCFYLYLYLFVCLICICICICKPYLTAIPFCRFGVHNLGDKYETSSAYKPPAQDRSPPQRISKKPNNLLLVIFCNHHDNHQNLDGRCFLHTKTDPTVCGDKSSSACFPLSQRPKTEKHFKINSTLIWFIFIFFGNYECVYYPPVLTQLTVRRSTPSQAPLLSVCTSSNEQSHIQVSHQGRRHKARQWNDKTWAQKK